jgi:hypothetical protein
MVGSEETKRLDRFSGIGDLLAVKHVGLQACGLARV